jgi:hypothetical protein
MQKEKKKRPQIYLYTKWFLYMFTFTSGVGNGVSLMASFKSQWTLNSFEFIMMKTSILHVLVKTYVKPYFRTEPHKLGFLPQNEFFHLCHHISKTHCLHLPRKSCLTNKYMVFPGAVYWTSEWLILDQWIGLASVNPSRNLSVIDFVQESSDYT